MLISDSIYLLDESLKQLPQMRDIETLMADEAAWNALTQQERQEREQQLNSSGEELVARGGLLGDDGRCPPWA